MTTIISGDTGIDKVSNGAVDLTTDVTGILPQGSGGTGASSLSVTGTLKNIQYFTTPGTATYTPTAGTTFIIVEVVGGGGNGATNTANGGGGGGGGGFARKKITSSFSGVTVTVGGATATSSFGALVSATGGSTSSNTFPNSGAGGIGSGGDLNVKGQSGMSCNTNASGGIGGSSFYGGGGQGGTTSSGSAGGQYGAGGGGSGTGGTGGAGASGIVIVYEYA